MAKQRFSVYLISEDYQSPERALASDNLKSIEIPVGEQQKGVLYYEHKELDDPPWLEVFGDAAKDQLKRLKSHNLSAVFFVEAERRLFAFTFGNGRHMIRRRAKVTSFGLRVVINSVDAVSGLRAMSSETLDGKTIRQRRQSAKSSGVRDFEPNVEQILLSSVEGTSTNDAFEGRISGRDAFVFSTNIDISRMQELLSSILKAYEKNDYQRGGFAWIDHLASVSDVAMRDRLNEALVEALRDPKFENVWAAMPEILGDESVDHFVIKGTGRPTDQIPEISWDVYLDSCGGNAAVTLRNLNNHEFIAKRPDMSTCGNWSIYDCLYVELELGGGSYFLNAGEWYRADPDYVATLDASVESLFDRTHGLPEFTIDDECEDRYLRRLAADRPSDFALMHTHEIKRSTDDTTIELCDLYSREGKLIHVKQYSSSSAMLSHLFNQGLASAELLVGDNVFQSRAREKVPDSHLDVFESHIADRKNVHVNLAIIDTLQNKDFELPLFSKITLRNALRRSNELGIGLSVSVIPSHHWNERKRQRHNGN